MPQLIAMVIVVVGAMIYMFQTFGGTGDKIEGVAQKSSIITEINNIKDGVKIAAKSGHIMATPSGDAVKTLEGLATLSYFAEQINTQLKESTINTLNEAGTDTNNTYNAISFGGFKLNGTTNESAMQISLVQNTKGMIPGLFIDLSKGALKDNKAFLEAQITKDLESIAILHRKADSSTAGALAATGTDAEKRIPVPATAGTDADGMFTIYFKDFGADEVVQ